jgi:S-adenosylmethionine:tRNA-ribosyltransferase-isomerase (queuine synthetase)
MIAAQRPDRRSAKLLTIDADGRMQHLPRVALASLFSAGDLVIANDAATLPASLMGTHCPSGQPIEVRFAAWVSVYDPTRFAAIAFGAGTTVVRALESAANADRSVRAGDGVASGRMTRETPLHVVDAILTGVHQPGDSHFELLRAFANDAVLDRISAACARHGYRTHEFGDSVLIVRCPRMARHVITTRAGR